MCWARSLIAAGMLLTAPAVGHALTQVSGPVQIGPSHGDGDTQNQRATLTTTITNLGTLPDRLVNVACPSAGAANLLNGEVQPVGNVARNGRDLPPSVFGHATPVEIRLALSQATLPMTAGTLVPCSLTFEHAGQRIVVFTLGADATPADEP